MRCLIKSLINSFCCWSCSKSDGPCGDQVGSTTVLFMYYYSARIMQLINGLSKNLFIINQQNLTKESAEAQSKLIGLLKT